MWWLPGTEGVLTAGRRPGPDGGPYFVLDRNGDLWNFDVAGEIVDVLPRDALP